MNAAPDTRSTAAFRNLLCHGLYNTVKYTLQRKMNCCSSQAEESPYVPRCFLAPNLL